MIFSREENRPELWLVWQGHWALPQLIFSDFSSNLFSTYIYLSGKRKGIYKFAVLFVRNKFSSNLNIFVFFAPFVLKACES